MRAKAYQSDLLTVSLGGRLTNEHRDSAFATADYAPTAQRRPLVSSRLAARVAERVSSVTEHKVDRSGDGDENGYGHRSE